MLSRSGNSVPGHADEARETGVTSLDGGPEGSVVLEGPLPLVLGDEVVKLDEIQMIGAEKISSPRSRRSSRITSDRGI